MPRGSSHAVRHADDHRPHEPQQSLPRGNQPCSGRSASVEAGLSDVSEGLRVTKLPRRPAISWPNRWARYSRLSIRGGSQLLVSCRQQLGSRCGKRSGLTWPSEAPRHPVIFHAGPGAPRPPEPADDDTGLAPTLDPPFRATPATDAQPPQAPIRPTTWPRRPSPEDRNARRRHTRCIVGRFGDHQEPPRRLREV
jgi:hypothetical protein